MLLVLALTLAIPFLRASGPPGRCIFTDQWKEPDMEATATTVPAQDDRRQAAQRIAAEMFHQTPDWITFFREVLGANGLVRRLFATPEEMAAFERTTEYSEIQKMIAKLRERSGVPVDVKENTRVITVRLPASLHESLKVEAHEKKTSINQLCISKLLQVLSDPMMPQV
jgi:predicted HicB family RNase H-like nuclease